MVQVIYLRQGQVYRSSITCKFIAGLPDDKEAREDGRTDDVTNNLHFLNTYREVLSLHAVQLNPQCD